MVIQIALFLAKNTIVIQKLFANEGMCQNWINRQVFTFKVIFLRLLCNESLLLKWLIKSHLEFMLVY